VCFIQLFVKIKIICEKRKLAMSVFFALFPIALAGIGGAIVFAMRKRAKMAILCALVSLFCFGAMVLMILALANFQGMAFDHGG
jgi:hypothetical protein